MEDCARVGVADGCPVDAPPHGPLKPGHKARLHGGLVHSVITPTSATAASTLPLNSLSDCTTTKKRRRGKKNQGPEKAALDDWRDVAT